MTGITKRQKEILDFIASFSHQHGYAPSYREIASHFKLNSIATVHQHIEALEHKGYLERQEGQMRSLGVIESNQEFAGLIDLPLVGLITAGEPIEAIEQRETIAVPENLISSYNSFVLKVKGTSMIEDGILDGDYVIVERNFYPQNGDVVVALINNTHATLKKYYKEKDRIRLQPANSSMAPIFVKNPAIQGIVRGIFRTFAPNI